MKSMSLQRKFMLIVGGSIAVMLFITAFLTVGFIGDSARVRVEQEVVGLVELEAQTVEEFFATYGGVARTFLNNPFLQDFFANHQRRGIAQNAIPQSENVFAMFTNISSSDANIKSAFFGTAQTGEYFYEEGIVGVDSDGPDAGDVTKGYFTTKRPWFNTAVAQGKLYVTPPAVDSQDGSVSAVVQAPLYKNGTLLGVGGVDILISTIGQVIDKIRYENQGFAFVVDEQQNLVYFPKQTEPFELSSPLASLDTVLRDTDGFAELTNAIRAGSQAFVPVNFHGEEYLAVFRPASLKDPKMDWTLGMMIPASLIQQPINAAITTSTIVSFVIILLITVVTYFASRAITGPLKGMRRAMAKIASGEGDLTRRLEVRSHDEIGQLATEFNLFTEKLQTLISATAVHTRDVSQAADRLKDVSKQTSQEMQVERQHVDMVSSAVTQMATTVQEISQNAAMSSQAAAQADKLTHSGSEQAKEAMAEIASLASSINQAAEVVSGLGNESENIGAVIDVINSIAEQTNLLALNAAIEAARAGEQGRGFAVVADEVRSLASRTQESTENIRRMVERLQSMAQQADTVMQDGKHKSDVGVDKAQQVVTSLQAISDAIGSVQHQSSQIAVATEQQTVAAESINKSLQTITGLSDGTSAHAEQLATEAVQLSGVAGELREIVGQFKI